MASVFSNLDKETLYKIVERKDKEKLEEHGGVEGLMTKLKSHQDNGIKLKSVELRRKYFGKNELPEGEQVTFFGLVIEALGDTMLRILIGAAIISLVLGLTVPDPKTGKVEYATGWIEGAAILASVIVVVTVTAWNDYTKALKFAELNKRTSLKEVMVKRDGQVARCDISQVVVGDILTIHYGDILGADGLYVSGEDIVCDESAQTGESHPIPKGADKDLFFLAGAMVIQGGGEMVVTGVGESSCNGKLAAALSVEKTETPLQEKLAEMANDIGFFGLYAAMLTFAVLAAKEVYFIVYGGHPFYVKPFLDFIIVAVTIVVVAIPEGLPLAVTISLAYSMKQMQTDNCLVRVLASCETMGGANTICSDKTGTLTCNRMSVVRGWVAETSFDLSPTSKFDPSTLPSSVVELLAENISLNSTAEQKRDDEGNLVWDGNKTEQGLLRFVADVLKHDYARTREAYGRKLRKQWPFNSEKKRMTTMILKAGKGYLLTKGAPEILLGECTQHISRDGSVAPLTAEVKASIQESIDEMADHGNRVLMIVQADTELTEIPSTEPHCKEYTCVALLGISDPVRNEVPGAVDKCQASGISVRMVTGDNIKTARSIARQCGILTDGGKVMEGKDFRELASAIKNNADRKQQKVQIKDIVDNLQVLARSSPEDKQVLTKMLQDAGMVVAVTGDGTNDGPALKMAHVGFSMNTGTDVAKNASDIVLMDDNFVSVVKAVMWGRNVNDNIKKFIQFQVTVNIVGVLITFIGSAFDEENESPLSPVQLLWLNLIMDTLAALALATEKPEEEVLLQRKPEIKGASLITPRMWVNIIGHASFQLVLLLWLLKDGAAYLGLEAKSLKHLTIYFNTFIWIQIWNEFNARKLQGEMNVFRGFFKNSKPHLAVTLVMILFQFAAVQFMGSFMHTTPLTLNEWFFSIAIGSLCIPYGVLLSFIPASSRAAKAAEPKPAPKTPATYDRSRRRSSLVEQTRNLRKRRDTVANVCQTPLSKIHVTKDMTDRGFTY